MKMYNKFLKDQIDICEKYSAEYTPPDIDYKVGIYFKDNSIAYPIHGLRHPIDGDTTGWYIWTGELNNDDADFFDALHVSHLDLYCPMVIKYLALPPGWRFLIAPNYEDVWYDDKLLEV